MYHQVASLLMDIIGHQRNLLSSLRGVCNGATPRRERTVVQIWIVYVDLQFDVLCTKREMCVLAVS